MYLPINPTSEDIITISKTFTHSEYAMNVIGVSDFNVVDDFDCAELGLTPDEATFEFFLAAFEHAAYRNFDIDEVTDISEMSNIKLSYRSFRVITTGTSCKYWTMTIYFNGNNQEILSYDFSNGDNNY